MVTIIFGLALPGPLLNGPNASIGPIEAKLLAVSARYMLIAFAYTPALYRLHACPTALHTNWSQPV